MNGRLCGELLGTDNSAQILAESERASPFVSVDSSGLWYRQHQLSAEALRMELQRTRSARVPILQAKAAAWLELEGDLESATEHAIAARDVDLAARLIANLIDESGEWAIADSIPNNSAAAIALIERTWAIRLRAGISHPEGTPLEDQWIHPLDLVEVGLMAADDLELA